VTLDIRTSTSLEELGSLAQEWDDLVAAAPRPSPYLLRAWVEEWLRGPGADAAVAVVSAHRDGRLVGLLPTCVIRRHGLRMLSFLGDHESWCADLLLAPDEPGSTASALLEEVRSCRFDVAAITGLPGTSLLEAAAGRELGAIARVGAPILDMPDGWEAAYAARASTQRRSRDRKRERQLAAAGELEIRIAQTPDEIAAVHDDVRALHDLRWSGKRDGSEFGTPAGARAQRAAFLRLGDSGHAGIVLLRLDGRPIGFQIWLAIGETMFLHRSGVDPAAMKFSPGLIAMRRAIAHGSSELGIRRVEMQGASDQYKLDLATRLGPMHDAFGLAQNPLGALAAGAHLAYVRARVRLRGVEPLRRLYLEGPAALRRRKPA
jgi:CelD/BcsL family acetyltransferase involved in cellulose biosynthesis